MRAKWMGGSIILWRRGTLWRGLRKGSFWNGPSLGGIGELADPRVWEGFRGIGRDRRSDTRSVHPQRSSEDLTWSSSGTLTTGPAAPVGPSAWSYASNTCEHLCSTGNSASILLTRTAWTPADHSYGTTFAALQKGSIRCILDIELQGVRQLKSRTPSLNLSPVFLFLSPPSIATLKSRLQGRGTETPESVRKRLDAAGAEIEYAQQGGHDLVLVNDDLDRATGILETVAMGWEGWEGVGDELPKMDVGELSA